MFSNLSWYEVVALLLIALFIFGDKLPRMIGEGLRMLRNLRRMAQNATSDLSRELGTDIQLEDLNPRSFVRKHVLSEADQERLLKPLKGVSDDVVRQTRGVERDLKEVSQHADRVTGEVRQTASWRGATKPARPAGRAADPARRSGRDADPAAPAVPGSAAGSPADPPLPRPGYEDMT